MVTSHPLQATGVTVFRITRGMDAGPVVAQCGTSIEPHETAGDLLSRLAESGSSVLVRAMQAVDAGRAAAVDQQPGEYAKADKITVGDAHVVFDAPVEAVDRQIRACTPNPGAWCALYADGGDESATLHVLRARPADPADPTVPAGLEPGRLMAGKRTVWVGTASTPLELIEVKAQGKKAMKAADWARGARLGDAAVCR